MKKTWLLLFWIAGILFPLAWLGKFSQGFRGAFDAVFGPLWVHLLMHAGLFAVLAILLTFQIEKRMPVGQGLRFLVVLGTALAVGLLQEGFQALSGGAFLPGAAAFDLGVDLAGGLAGWAFAQGGTLQRGNHFKQG